MSNQLSFNKNVNKQCDQKDCEHYADNYEQNCRYRHPEMCNHLQENGAIDDEQRPRNNKDD